MTIPNYSIVQIFRLNQIKL